jgi:hypothetical protein
MFLKGVLSGISKVRGGREKHIISPPPPTQPSKNERLHFGPFGQFSGMQALYRRMAAMMDRGHGSHMMDRQARQP